jgi:hypothetical protein
MGPLSYMQSIAEQNVIMRRMTVSTPIPEYWVIHDTNMLACHNDKWMWISSVRIPAGRNTCYFVYHTFQWEWTGTIEVKRYNATEVTYAAHTSRSRHKALDADSSLLRYDTMLQVNGSLHPEDAGTVVLQNFRNYLPNDTTSHPRRHKSYKHCSENVKPQQAMDPCLFSTTHGILLRLIVRSGLDVPTFATRRLHACHQARAPSAGKWNCGREMFRNFA